LLSGKGFKEVYNLAGGIKAWQGGVTSGPPEMGMGLITGEETGAQMLAIIYSMEEGMRSLFERLSKRVSDEEAADLFRTLSELEVHHKKMIFDLYKAHGGEIETTEAMDREASGDVIEGGLNVDEIAAAFRPETSAVEDVLSFAMMLETQALDLFLRYLQRSTDFDTKAVLMELAEQEKSHLKYLGELMEKKTETS
jgi:rubrerythrin